MHRFLIAAVFWLTGTSVHAGVVTVPFVFTDETVAKAEEVNANFEYLYDRIKPLQYIVGYYDTAIDSTRQNVQLGGFGMYLPLMEGKYNTGIGFYTLNKADAVAEGNTAVGHRSLGFSTSGTSNTAIGKDALWNNLTGSFNTAVGSGAMRSNRAGSGHTFIGYQAGELSNPSATPAFGVNTGVGYRAMASDALGSGNTALGGESLGCVSGDKNIAIGTAAGSNPDFSSDPTCVGGKLIRNNTISIGYAARPINNNMVQIGNADITDVYFGKHPGTSTGVDADLHTEGNVYANDFIGDNAAPSDKNLKKNISDIGVGLQLIRDLKPVVYTRLDKNDAHQEMGLLAQDLAAALSSHNLDANGVVTRFGEEDHFAVRYTALLAPVIRAIQELDDGGQERSAELSAIQEKQIAQQSDLEEKVEHLLALVTQQQLRIAQLESQLGEQFAAR